MDSRYTDWIAFAMKWAELLALRVEKKIEWDSYSKL